MALSMLGLTWFVSGVSVVALSFCFSFFLFCSLLGIVSFLLIFVPSVTCTYDTWISMDSSGMNCYIIIGRWSMLFMLTILGAHEWKYPQPPMQVWFKSLISFVLNLTILRIYWISTKMNKWIKIASQFTYHIYHRARVQTLVSHQYSIMITSIIQHIKHVLAAYTHYLHLSLMQSTYANTIHSSAFRSPKRYPHILMA